MPSEALVCPSCRAPVTSGANADGQYTCGYCGTPFHRNAANSPPIVVNINQGGGASGHTVGQQSSNSAGVALAVALVAALVLMGAVAALFLVPGDADSDSDIGVDIEPSVVEISGSSPNPERVGVKVAPSQTAKAEAEKPATADFEFHTKYTGYQTSYYALGKVTNTSPFVIDHPKINAVLVDAEGNEVGTDFGFAARDSLAPGKSSPIKILVNDPPPHDSVRYEVVVKKAFYIPKEVAGLRVEPMEPQAARYGANRWEIEGKVFNEGDTPAKFVSIEILAIDTEGKYIGIDSTFADGDVLAPGGTARWKALSMQTAGPVDHFEFSVSGRPAD